MYKNTRCPFTLNFRKLIGSKYFALYKYRSEHNHTLSLRNELFKVNKTNRSSIDQEYLDKIEEIL